MGNSSSAEEALKKREDELKKREEECKKREDERIRLEILENNLREKLWKELELKNHQQEMLRRQEDLRRFEAQQKAEQELQKREEELRRIKVQQEELRKVVDQKAQKICQQDGQKPQNYLQQIEDEEEALQRIKDQKEVKKQDQLQRIKEKQEKSKIIEDQKEKRQQDELQRIKEQQEELKIIEVQKEEQKKRQQDVQKRQEKLQRIETEQRAQELDDNIKIDQMVQERVRLELEREKLKLQEVFNWQQREQQKKERLQKQKIFIDSLKQYKITKNLFFINDLRRSFGLYVLKDYPPSPYTKRLLLGTSYKYRKVQQMFRKGNSFYFHVTKILEIDNPFLVLHYGLTKEKLTEDNDGEIDESVLFHGTKCENLDGICTFNFDQSKVKKHGFGWGMSFTTRSSCATHHHKDNMRKNEKVMVLAKVLVDKAAELGNVQTVIPKEPCYTTTNRDKSVIVKFDNASFYPVYIVHYEGMHHFMNKQNGSREQLTTNE